VGAMSTGGGFGHRWGRNVKNESCVAVGPATQDCWHTGWSQLKALAFNLSWPSGQYGFYASLLGFNPRRLKTL